MFFAYNIHIRLPYQKFLEFKTGCLKDANTFEISFQLYLKMFI